ncbi:MAG: hypothetical protein CMM02_16960 [Rhodopirellula sp.]|jgi:predicted RNA-binding protein|nr:hypothetical protein [Rhodopirellula sp.]|tara:strand:- start:216 stop:617 length:402 start_codon:yes stop_codon:yes gene_type:complete
MSLPGLFLNITKTKEQTGGKCPRNTNIYNCRAKKSQKCNDGFKDYNSGEEKCTSWTLERLKEEYKNNEGRGFDKLFTRVGIESIDGDTITYNKTVDDNIALYKQLEGKKGREEEGLRALLYRIIRERNGTLPC